MKIGFCFAGQGAQAKGMGLDFYNEYSSSKEIYDKFKDIRDLCFYDKDDVINQTKYAQKAMLLTSYVIASLIKENNIEPTYVAGLSLGEYTALLFSDVWSLEDSLKIVTRRGEIMQNALPLGTTKMAAIIGCTREVIKETIKDIKGVCEIANYNCPGQIVITGENEAVDQAMELLKPKARRCIALNVSGAFHCSLLNDASLELRKELDKYTPSTPKYKVVYNYTGKESNEGINDILQKQICNSVYFEDSIRYMLENGVDTFIEIGPGKTLSGFIKKTDAQAKVYNVSDVSSLKELLEEFKNA